MAAALTWIVTLALALGILPSLTALSASIAAAAPSIARYLGPLNPLKVLFPLILAQLVIRRREIPRPTGLLLLTAFVVGSLATLVSAASCGFPPAVLREWGTVTIGTVAALALTTLPPLNIFFIISFWCAAVYGSLGLEQLSNSAADWLYQNVFDPQTLSGDFKELGRRAFTGIFGRQSLSKFLAWLPWIAGTWLSSLLPHPRLGRPGAWVALGIMTVLSTGLVLGTSQRGPFVGAMAGWAVFILHSWIRRRDSRFVKAGVIGALLSLAFTASLVPKDILESRVLPTFNQGPSNSYAELARNTRDFRKNMTLFSLRIIGESPLGNACIPADRFWASGVHPAHSHSLLLHQFRERGWAWGLFHAALWLLALFNAWKFTDIQGSFIVGGLACILVSGLVDHPWFVLNQAMVLALLLIWGLNAGSLRPRRGGTAPPARS